MKTEIYEAIKQDALKRAPFEACGFIVLDGKEPKILPTSNDAEDPLNFFSIRDTDYLSVKSKYKILGVYHSHPAPDHDDGFSKDDINNCNNTLLPYYLYVNYSDKFYDILPKSRNEDIIGKPFIWGIYDCFTVFKEYFWQRLQIHVDDFPRNEAFFESPDTRIENNYSSFGFVALPANEPIKAHDAIVYYGKKMMPQHFAIYIGNGYICHHIIHRLSAREPISSFNKKIAFILRHKSQM